MLSPIFCIYIFELYYLFFNKLLNFTLEVALLPIFLIVVYFQQNLLLMYTFEIINMIFVLSRNVILNNEFVNLISK